MMFDDDPADQDFLMEDEAPESSVWVRCPYCGESSEIFVDPAGGEDQSYVEDCQVCCRPWSLRVRWEEGSVQLEVHTEDESGF